MWMLVVLAACAGETGAAAPHRDRRGAIDFLDFFCKPTTATMRWTINGTDVDPRPIPMAREAARS